jgi:hypothetical protein
VWSEQRSRERPKDQWIEIAVPALVSEKRLPERRLAENRRVFIENTKARHIKGCWCVAGGYSLYRTRREPPNVKPSIIAVWVPMGIGI